MDDETKRRIAVADRLWVCMDARPGDEQVIPGLTADDLRDLAVGLPRHHRAQLFTHPAQFAGSSMRGQAIIERAGL